MTFKSKIINKSVMGYRNGSFKQAGCWCVAVMNCGCSLSRKEPKTPVASVQTIYATCPDVSSRLKSLKRKLPNEILGQSFNIVSMPGQLPTVIRLYRIVHIDNVEYLLRHGMYTKHHAMADPNYIDIGDNGLIQQRNDYPVGITPPNGILGEYVPFYFGPLSPMLLNIKTGYRGITQRPQEDIVYICCRFETIVANCPEWCFTDGHAKDRLTDFYNNMAQLSEVYWDVVSTRYWHPTEEFPEKQVRKQAEFLIKNHVPVGCITGIVVYNEQKRIIAQKIVTGLALQISVVVNPNSQFYY